MVDPYTRRLWTMRTIFVLLALVILFTQLLPLESGPPRVPAPDLLLALTLAWLLRQPSAVPIGAIFVLFLLADLLLARPPGLWTALVLVASESLRIRRSQMTELPFLLEWSFVAATVMSLLIANRIVMWALILDLPGLLLTLAHGLVTIAAYPFVVAVSKYAFGLRKLGPAETEAV